MTQKTTKKRQTAAQWVQNKRLQLAKKLAGGAFVMSPRDSVRLAGCVVFWYEQEGYRHYVTVKTKASQQMDGLVRFPSFFGLLPGKDAAETMRASIHVQLGGAFVKAVNMQELAADTVTAAPTFRWHDKSIGTVDCVQLLVWDMQITPEQARVIASGDAFDVMLVPEFAMSGKRISRAHKLIFQSVQKRIQAKAKPMFSPTQVLEQLDELLGEEVDFHNRTIH